ncbi:unnamed protein product, partial [Urochloa humidicola]
IASHSPTHSYSVPATPNALDAAAARVRPRRSLPAACYEIQHMEMAAALPSSWEELPPDILGLC